MRFAESVMPRMDQSDHTTILDTLHRYARVDAVHTEDDTLDATFLNGLMQPDPAEVWLRLPIFYHCIPDPVIRPNGALEHAARAFQVGDTAIIKVEDPAHPVVVAIKGELRRCPVAAATFKRLDDGRIFMADTIAGKPWLGNVVFSGLWEWGAGEHVWMAFTEGSKHYWVLDNGAVWHLADPFIDRYPRRPAMEVACVGLLEGVQSFSVIWTGATFRMAVSFLVSEGEVVHEYRSADGVNWVYQAVLFDAHNVYPTKLIGASKVATGSGVWHHWPPRESYFVEYLSREAIPGHPLTYPANYYRLWRIGIWDRWDAYGNLVTERRAWTAYDEGGMAAYYFNLEGDFTLDGASIQDVDLVQIVGNMYL
jgi:hypothetical protein